MNSKLPRKVQSIRTAHKPVENGQSKDHKERSVHVKSLFIIVVHSEKVEDQHNGNQILDVGSPGTPVSSGSKSSESVHVKAFQNVAGNVGTQNLHGDPEDTFDWVHFLVDDSVQGPGTPPVAFTEDGSEDHVGDTDGIGGATGLGEDDYPESGAEEFIEGLFPEFFFFELFHVHFLVFWVFFFFLLVVESFVFLEFGEKFW